MNKSKFQKFNKVISTVFFVLFWIEIACTVLVCASLLYTLFNYEQILATMLEYFNVVGYSKGYYLLQFVDLVLFNGITCYLYFQIYKTGKAFYQEETPYTENISKHLMHLAIIFLALYGISIITCSIASSTLSLEESLLYVTYDTGLSLGLVFIFVSILVKKAIKPSANEIKVETQKQEDLALEQKK